MAFVEIFKRVRVVIFKKSIRILLNCGKQGISLILFG